ncbi:hypothetical protein D3C87_1462970 [compost metagenome]
MPPKSNPKLPSLASIRDVNAPPARRSFSALGVCQSSEALHHFMMSCGFDQNSHTFSTGAFTVAATVILVLFAVSIFLLFVYDVKIDGVLVNDDGEKRH